MATPPKTTSDFPPTQWTLVHRAVAQADPGAIKALSSLCEAYYHPLLSVIRSRGYGIHDAEDLRQRFFIHLVDRGRFDTALSKDVRLRAFLLRELKGFLIDHYRHSTAAKRDERKNDSMDDPERQGADPEFADWSTPDLEYDRSWRKALITQSMKALGALWEEKRLAGKDYLPFAELAPLLSYRTEETQRDAAERLGINENTLKTHLREMRAELGKQITHHVTQTLVNPTKEAVQAEISALQLMK